MIVLLSLASVLALSMFGQTAIYVGGGPSFYAPATPAADLTIGVCNGDGSTCSLSNFEATQIGRDLSKTQYSVATGIRQRVASVTTGSMTVELFTLAQIGANITGNAAAGAVPLGGGFTFHPAKYPNWAFSLVAKEVYSPVNPGWQPWGGVQVGYTFRGK